MKLLKLFIASSLLLIASSCGNDYEKKTMEVTASAYNSLAYQTANDPTLTAWGDTLKPGMKAIAVSRDLIDSGLTHMTEVQIKGLPGTYIVRDKMNRRWTKKIDIYFGTDVDRARSWGRKDVTITYKVPNKEDENA